MKNKEQQTMEVYEPPKIEVIEVGIEKGFAASNPIGGTTTEEDMGGGGGGSFPW